MNFIGLIFVMLVEGNAQDVPNDKETNRGWRIGVGRRKIQGGGYAIKKNRGGGGVGRRKNTGGGGKEEDEKIRGWG